MGPLKGILLKKIKAWLAKKVGFVIGFVVACILAAAGISYLVQAVR